MLPEYNDTANTYVILVGDLINNSVRNSVANPFDEVLRPMDQKKRMIEHLTPIRDKILCAVSGNHERRSKKDSDVDLTYDIMSKLDLEDIYRESMVFMKVGVGTRAKEKNAANSYTFCVTHGAGGGIFTGATVNRNERFGNVVEGLDCLVVGHTHKGTITRPNKLVFDNRRGVVTVKSYVVVSSVSWLNYGGYAAQKMLLPAETCRPQKLVLSGDKNNKNIEVVW